MNDIVILEDSGTIIFGFMVLINAYLVWKKGDRFLPSLSVSLFSFSFFLHYLFPVEGAIALIVAILFVTMNRKKIRQRF